VLINKMPRYEILSEEAIATLDRGWRRIVSELGIEFLSDEALELFGKAGQKVEGQSVKLDPDFVVEQVAKAPRQFDLQARNPERNVHIGGDHMVFSPVYGCPFIRDGLERRDAALSDFQNLARLAQSFPQLDSVGGTICEPNDVPLDSRHLDMVFNLMTLSDKPFMGSVTSGPNAADTIAMAEMLFAAPLRRPHARGDVRVHACEPAGDRDAVPPHGGDVARFDRGDAHPADGGGDGRDRAHPVDPARLPGRLWILLVEH
jgi:trimethylamine--corrinoid protein Co-methyltransferase